MNKADLKRLAANRTTTSDEDLQERLYIALVGGSDFTRTMCGAADVCRLAYKNSLAALKVWREMNAPGVE
jgi:hypothetical protein